MNGENYCIMDHEAVGILELTRDEVWRLVVEGGAVIHGLSREQMGFESMRRLVATSQCNWADGKNIFGSAKRLRVNGDNEFTITAEDRPFNGVVNDDWAFIVIFEFDFGVQVPMMRDDFEVLLSGDVPRVVETLKSLASPFEYDDSMLAAYEAVKESEDADAVKATVRSLVAAGRYPINWG